MYASYLFNALQIYPCKKRCFKNTTIYNPIVYAIVKIIIIIKEQILCLQCCRVTLAGKHLSLVTLIKYPYCLFSEGIICINLTAWNQQCQIFSLQNPIQNSSNFNCLFKYIASTTTYVLCALIVQKSISVSPNLMHAGAVQHLYPCIHMKFLQYSVCDYCSKYIF